MRVAALAVLLTASSGLAQGPLYAVTFTGQFYQLNTSTGAASLVGQVGIPRLNSAAMTSVGQVYTTHIRDTTITTDTNQLVAINSATGVGTVVADWGVGHDIRAIAFADGDVLYAIEDASPSDLLVMITVPTGVVTVVGPTGRGDLQGLTSAPGGALFAIGVTPGQVFRLDPNTGAATLVGGSFLTDNQTIEFASGTSAWVARVSLQLVDLTTGVATFIGGTGLTDIRGLAGYRPAGGSSCYANCDGSTASPILNALDFGCFLTKFAAGDSYANCDGSTAAPVLNALDFGCFLTKFAAGCP